MNELIIVEVESEDLNLYTMEILRGEVALPPGRVIRRIVPITPRDDRWINLISLTEPIGHNQRYVNNLAMEFIVNNIDEVDPWYFQNYLYLRVRNPEEMFRTGARPYLRWVLRLPYISNIPLIRNFIEGIIDPVTGEVVTGNQEKEELFREYDLRIQNPPAYRDFETNDDTTYDNNCLINLVLTKYHYGINNKNHRISERMIRRYFDRHGTTLEALIGWLNKYGIRHIIWDLTGKPIAMQQETKNNKRPTFKALVGHQHIYWYTKRVKWHAIGIYPKEDPDKEYILDAFKEILGNLRSYASYHYPFEDILMRSLHYYEDYPENTRNLQGIDVNKCYYNALMTWPETCDIPVFNCTDIPTKYTGGYIHPSWYYWVDKIPFAYTDNLLTGFELRYLIEIGELDKSNIKWVKSSNRMASVKLADIRKYILKNLPEPHDKQIQKMFSVFGGLCARYKPPNYKQVLTDYQPDLKLIASTHPDSCIRCVPLVNGEDSEINSVSIRVLNTNMKDFRMTLYPIYNYMVARSRLFVYKQIVELRKTHKIYKVKTDGLVFAGPYYPTPSGWKPEEIKKSNKVAVKMKYPDLSDYQKYIEEKGNHVEVITGPPGTGKTTLMRKKISKEPDKYRGMTWTNICCRNMDIPEVNFYADTLYSQLKMFDFSQYTRVTCYIKKNHLWIDEYSMIPRRTFNYLLEIASKENPMTLTGDVNQTPPVNENPLNHNDLFFKWFFKNTTELDVDYRNDSETIKFRKIILKHSADQIYHICESKTFTGNVGSIDLHLTYRNNIANYINRQVLAQRNLQCYRKIIRFTQTKKGRKPVFAYHFDAGVILRMTSSQKAEGIYRHERYEVLETFDSLKDDQLRLRILRNGQEIIITAKNRANWEHMVPGYAISTHKSQGLTIDKPYIIHEYDEMIKRKLWSVLYTAVTRTTKYDYLNFLSAPKVKVKLAPIMTYNMNGNQTEHYDSIDSQGDDGEP